METYLVNSKKIASESYSLGLSIGNKSSALRRPKLKIPL
jgi:hypothetical protein